MINKRALLYDITRHLLLIKCKINLPVYNMVWVCKGNQFVVSTRPSKMICAVLDV